MLSEDSYWKMAGLNEKDNILDIESTMQRSNLYAYSINNPIMYNDPSGNVITVSGFKEEQKLIMDTLKALTDDQLKVKKGVVTYTVNKNAKRKDGSALVRSLIDSKYICNIIISNNDLYGSHVTDFSEDGFVGEDGYWGKGSNVTVYLDPLQDLSGTSVSDLPFYLVLGHELVHAQRATNGMLIRANQTQDYVVNGVTYNTLKEELITTGIWTQNENNPMKQGITENTLRKENGLKSRQIY